MKAVIERSLEPNAGGRVGNYAVPPRRCMIGIVGPVSTLLPSPRPPDLRNMPLGGRRLLPRRSVARFRRPFLNVEDRLQSDPILMAEIMEAADEDCP